MVIEAARFLTKARNHGLGISVNLSLENEKTIRSGRDEDSFNGWELSVLSVFKLDRGPLNRVGVMLNTANWREDLPRNLGFVHYEDLAEFQCQ